MNIDFTSRELDVITAALEAYRKNHAEAADKESRKARPDSIAVDMHVLIGRETLAVLDKLATARTAPVRG